MAVGISPSSAALRANWTVPALGDSLRDCIGLLQWRQGMACMVGMGVLWLRRGSGGSGRVPWGDPVLARALARGLLGSIGVR